VIAAMAADRSCRRSPAADDRGRRGPRLIVSRGPPALMLCCGRPKTSLEISMKIKATIEVEFEMDRGQPENAANAALARGRTELHRAIERGITSMPTGVRRESVKVAVTRQETIP
jgi:hypothetical protein